MSRGFLNGRVADFLFLSADFRFLLLGVIFQHFESAAIIDVVSLHGWPRVVMTEAHIVACCVAGGAWCRRLLRARAVRCDLCAGIPIDGLTAPDCVFDFMRCTILCDPSLHTVSCVCSV